MVDVDLRSQPNQTLLWLLLGLLASSKSAETVQISFRSRGARSVTAGVCVLVAAWVLYSAVVQPVRADCWERKARLAEVRGDISAAASAARRSLEIQPLRVETRYFLAGVLAENPATYGLAINEGLVLEEIAPDYSDLTYNIGQLYLKLHKPDEALPFLQRAARINPYSAAKRFALGLALAESSQPLAAEQELETAVRLRPDYAEAADLLQRLRQQTAPVH
jgi:tetratricopeptide (TPR) repeat protein